MLDCAHRKVFRKLVAERRKSRAKANHDVNIKRRAATLKELDNEIAAMEAVINAPIWGKRVDNGHNVADELPEGDRTH